jgi:putative component of membrane protein insertase Oxa1/YidC/SpoIIIJ protein YidD
MVAAILEWGVAKGTWMGIKRIGRCHPWGGFGYDPVPENPDNQNAGFVEEYFLKKK